MAEGSSRSKQFGGLKYRGRGTVHQGDDYRHYLSRIRVGQVVFNIPKELSGAARPIAWKPARTRARGSRNVKFPVRAISAKKQKSSARTEEEEIELDEEEYGGNNNFETPTGNVAGTTADPVIGTPEHEDYDLEPEPLSPEVEVVEHLQEQLQEHSIIQIVPRDEIVSDVKDAKEFLFLCASILSVLFGRQCSVSDTLTFLTQCPHDRFFPLLTFIFGIGLVRFISGKGLNGCQPTSKMLTLEDAYGQPRTVAVDVFTDFGAVKNFLLDHYRHLQHRAGEIFVRKGQFKLDLVLEDGQNVSMTRTNWSSVAALIKPGARLTSAVYVKIMTMTCLSCHKVMTVSAVGTYHCPRCKSLCRYRQTSRGEHARHEIGDELGGNTTNIDSDHEQHPLRHSDFRTHVDLRLVARPNTLSRWDTSANIQQGKMSTPKSQLESVGILPLEDVHALVLNKSDTRSRSQALPQEHYLSKSEQFIFSFRRYTHAALCFGHWDDSSTIQSDVARQAIRGFASDLSAGRALHEEGKSNPALGHWHQAQSKLTSKELLQTWYSEAPTRILFELGRLAHTSHTDVASRMLKDLKSAARQHFARTDARSPLFDAIGDLNANQLREAHALAARSMYKSLEAHLEKGHPRLFELRLNRALDFLWFDPEVDLKDWLSIDEVDRTLGPTSPYAVYFLLVQAFRCAAAASFDEVEQTCWEAQRRLDSLGEHDVTIDSWRVGMAYRRLALQLHTKRRYEDARRHFLTALEHFRDGSRSASVYVEIYQHLETIARALEDEREALYWANKLFECEVAM